MYEIYGVIIFITIVLISASLFGYMKKRGQADKNNILNLMICTVLAIVSAIFTPLLARTMIKRLYFSIIGSVILSLIILIVLAACIFFLIQRYILPKLKKNTVVKGQIDAKIEASSDVETQVQKEFEIETPESDAQINEEVITTEEYDVAELEATDETEVQEESEIETLAYEESEAQINEEILDTEEYDDEVIRPTDETEVQEESEIETPTYEESDLQINVENITAEEYDEIEIQAIDAAEDEVLYASAEAAASEEIFDIPADISHQEILQHVSDEDSQDGSVTIEELIEKAIESKYERNYSDAISLYEKAIKQVQTRELLEVLAVELCSLYKINNQNNMVLDFLKSYNLMLNPAIKEEILQNL